MASVRTGVGRGGARPRTGPKVGPEGKRVQRNFRLTTAQDVLLRHAARSWGLTLTDALGRLIQEGAAGLLPPEELS